MHLNYYVTGIWKIMLHVIDEQYRFWKIILLLATEKKNGENQLRNFENFSQDQLSYALL